MDRAGPLGGWLLLRGGNGNRGVLTSSEVARWRVDRSVNTVWGDTTGSFLAELLARRANGTSWVGPGTASREPARSAGVATNLG